MKKKICFFGLGSIGKRHLKNLRKLENDRNDNFEIHAFRSSTKKLPEDIEKNVDKEIYKKVDFEKYDIVFITNPTILHFQTIKEIVNKTRDMFIEKPIFSETFQNICEIDFKEDSVYYTACPLRFNPVIEYLNWYLNDKKIFSVRTICSSYLPEWRKGVDYRNVYSARKELGGGVSIDLIHELDYLKYLFGYPENIVNVRGKYSNLEINTEDLSLYILEYDDKLIELHLDYFGRIPQRKIEIYTNEEIILCDLYTQKIRFLKREKEIQFEKEDIYIKEMNYFLDRIDRREKSFNEPIDAYKTLGLCEGKIL